MMFHLDTNVCIDSMRGKNRRLVQRLAASDPNELRVCSVVVGELFYGANKSGRILQNLPLVRAFLSTYRSLPFLDAAAEIFGQIKNQLKKAGTPIGPYDLQIAAIALANGATLVTHNTAEFRRVPNLLLDDWQV